ncbi:conserved hypothetical protein [Paecilomyces variotii No. 5]|uniref:DUF7729 domain-containing protein n=1 Tax=Byssochlamys spectabilis (strain No. 5 / NBRC 109023) TaxID=1356009 RepID=V5FL69_BYSSN|nr:conserved hypothetical protein [Paecilomyces variotii No. 5]
MKAFSGSSLGFPDVLRSRSSSQRGPSNMLSRHRTPQSQMHRRELPTRYTSFSTKLCLLLVSMLLMFYTPVSAAVISVRSSDATISNGVADSARGWEIIVDRQASSPLHPIVEEIQTTTDNNDLENHNDEKDETLEELLTHIKRADSSQISSRSTYSTSLQAESFPSPFDSATFGSNFTSDSCPNFIEKFLSNSTVTSCHAVSLLLQNSQSWFHSLSSAAAISNNLDIACSAPMASCTDILADLASQLISDDACGKDYKQGNPVVENAYTGMIAYQPIYRASCLKDPSTNNYCLSEAVRNSSSVMDYSIYFLPLGMNLPASGRATCNACLQATMQIFSEASESQGQPLTKTYIPAAQQLNLGCGPNYINTTIPIGSKQAIGAGSLTSPNMAFVSSGFAFVLGTWLLGML